jgi:FG-GAP repeat protein
VRSGTTWSRQAKLTAAAHGFQQSLGTSVALSGTTVVAGAPGKNSFTGAAYVFARSGTTWSQQAKLTAAHGAANDSFGNSVALSGATAVAGAPFENANAGAAYVFRKV